MEFKFAKLLAAAGLATIVSATPAFADPHPASGTGTATVKILKAIVVTNPTSLNFGKVLPGSSAATIAVAENNAVTCDTALECLGSPTAASFHVTGTSGETVTVALDASTATLSDGASNSMTVDLATTTSNLALTGGANDFKVSGVLHVGANQVDGDYTGNFTVSVDYQ